MPQNASRLPGRHFLQIPGPTPMPDRMHAGDGHAARSTSAVPEFAKMTKRVLEGIKTIFKTAQPVIIYTATGTGAWEAALTNTLSPGDRVLMVETGQFATLWKVMAERLGLEARIHQAPIGASAPIRKSSRSICARTRRTRSRRSASCTTRPRPAACRRSMRSARPSMPPAIRRCFWSIPSPRSPRRTTGTTNGASTSPSAARRRA